MKDQSINIYSGRYVYFGGEIKDGKLSLVSEVYGDDYDSEKHYEFSQEETKKLFEIISVDDFVAMCRKDSLIGFEDFLREHNITCRQAVI